MVYTQTTIKKSVELEGVGLHSGEKARVKIHPAGQGAGLVFVYRGTRIPALAEYARAAARNTVLTDGKTELHTVEHVLSALYGLEIDNAEIELSAPEPPAMDGSPLPFCEALIAAGRHALGAESEYIEIDEMMIADSASGAAALALPDGDFRISFALSYSHPLITTQGFDTAISPEIYSREVAPARTYGFIEEVQPLLDSGLAKGASEENAVVIYPGRYSCDLRFPDEPVRHKAADFIGDLALLGRRARGHFIGYKSGHALNAELVKKINTKMKT